MIQRFFAPGTFPGLNEVIAAAKVGGRGRVYSALKERCDNVVTLAIRQHRLIPVPWAAFTFHWIEPRRNRDPDNVTVGQKFILDSLVSEKILPGDGWKHVRGLYHPPPEVATESIGPGVFVTMESP